MPRESLTDSEGWTFLTTLGGEAAASVGGGTLRIDTANAGTVDYSVQLVQPDLPMQKGGEYQVSFEAWADAPRTLKVGVSAPDRGYKRYLEDTAVQLGTEPAAYTYAFTMTDDDDPNGRLEFNLGAAGSTAGVTLRNVRVVKTGQTDLDNPAKTVLADGNYVYNGSFQEGEGRLGFWSRWALPLEGQRHQ